MKKVFSGKELKDKIMEAIDLLCNSVGSTLGPSGNNVLINNDNMSPFITNDGVTIARNIESEDKIINSILEIAKEASLKTEEEVGDGTTTTLVLLQAIYKEGIKEVAKGINPITLKKELNDILTILVKEIENLKRLPSEEDLENIASIASGSLEVGKFLTEIYLKMQSKYSIKLDESRNSETYYNIQTGYNLEIDNIPTVYFTNNSEIELKDASVLLIRNYLSDLEQIAPVINESLERNKNIVILADDYDIEIERQILIYYLQYHKNIFIFKLPDYGSRKEKIIEDILTLINTDNNYNSFNNIGNISKFIIRKNEIIFINDEIDKKYISKIKKELNNTTDDYEKEFMANRLAKLDKGIAFIYVGGNTRSEIKEKMMHFEDALYALDIASNGVVAGEGITYLKISEILDNKTSANKIMKKALTIPLEKIIENVGLKVDDIKNKIILENYDKVYNFSTNNLEDFNNTKIIDPKDVIIMALKNAVSIASLLLTTNYLVINDTISVKQNLEI